MARGDNRKSLKMRQKASQKKLKERLARRALKLKEARSQKKTQAKKLSEKPPVVKAAATAE